ncbi:MAG: tripartite tricarboxylate transporter substrate-binding protein [Pseudomonadota bacterium]
MTRYTITILALTSTMAVAALPLASLAGGEQSPARTDLTLLVPGHEGGGWDSTTRAVGELLETAGLVAAVSYENVGGENGALGLAHFLENAPELQDTLMLNSTQIVLRSVNGSYEKSYTELVPIAAPVTGCIAFIVHPGSDLQTMGDLADARSQAGADFALGGGSEPGGIDHVASAMAMATAGQDVGFDYLQFEDPAAAFQALTTGEAHALATDCTRAFGFAEQGALRILGVTAGSSDDLPNGVQTLEDQGIDMELVTWSGFFAAPGVSETQTEAFEELFSALYEAEAWESAAAAKGWAEPIESSESFAKLLQTQEAAIREALSMIEAAKAGQ